MVSNIFYVHPYLGKIPVLTNIFQMGWNHQLATISQLSESKAPTVFLWQNNQGGEIFWTFFTEMRNTFFAYVPRKKVGMLSCPGRPFVKIRVGLGVNQPPHFSKGPDASLLFHGGFQFRRLVKPLLISTSNPQSCWYVFATYSHPMSLKGIISLHAPKKVPIENPNRYMMLPWQVFVSFLGWW